jgi:hypothetical protein
MLLLNPSDELLQSHFPSYFSHLRDVHVNEHEIVKTLETKNSRALPVIFGDEKKLYFPDMTNVK